MVLNKFFNLFPSTLLGFCSSSPETVENVGSFEKAVSTLKHSRFELVMSIVLAMDNTQLAKAKNL